MPAYAAMAAAAEEMRGKKKEEARLVEAVNFGSATSYPSLGSSTGPKPSTMNYKKMVAVIPPKIAAKTLLPTSTSTLLPTLLPTPKAEASWDQEEEEEEEEEFNADLETNRRRGDKGIW